MMMLFSKIIRLNALLLLFALLCYSIGAGQDQMLGEISAGAGISIPIAPGDFTYQWNTGYNLGGSVAASLSPIVGLGIAIDFSRYGFDGTKLFLTPSGPYKDDVILEGGSANILTVSPEIKAMFSRNRGRISPFVLVGMGYYLESTNDLTVNDNTTREIFTFQGTSHSAVFMSIGLGVDIFANESMGIILQSQFFHAFTENQATEYAMFRAAVRFGH